MGWDTELADNVRLCLCEKIHKIFINFYVVRYLIYIIVSVPLQRVKYTGIRNKTTQKSLTRPVLLFGLQYSVEKLSLLVC